MGWIDWLIVVVPTAFVMFMGLYSRRYARGVADFLAAGRICGRYVISVGDVANALAIIGLVAFVEVHYKTGFALAFWQHITGPLGIIMGLLGFCIYRFRETKAMSLGQFLEMRYSRKFRIFAATLRSISEMLANMIMPAIAARFFIYYLGLPISVDIFGVGVPTFMLVVIICLTMAISLICMGGTLALVITDAIQGMFCFPLIVTFVVFILCKFSWTDQIVPVMIDRVQGESFLNPYDIANLRDFNLLMVVITVFAVIFHRASWIGAGTSGAAKSPHEQKMAGLLGTWRQSISAIFYVLIAVAIITLMNHRDWAPNAKVVRDNISARISEELLPDAVERAQFDKRLAAVPAQIHHISLDAPLSQDNNLDTPTLKTAHQALKDYKGETAGNAKFQQFRTLYNQMMMAMSIREMLPPVLTGLFCLLMVLAMISTDDTRIYSATVTITQDVIMPLRKTPFTLKQHVWALRIVAMGIGVFFFCGSFFMAQLDYINLFVTLMVTMWMGGCGPVMIFGLYGRFGTTAGAFTSLITGMLLSFSGIFVMRNWADGVYPWLVKMGWVEGVGVFLETVSRPLNPYVVWKMDPVKFPVNSYELYLFTMLLSLVLYCVVSKLTMKEPFNLDRMLHRGIYNIDGDKKETVAWSFRTVLSKLMGITPEYTTGDKVIAWSFLIYSFVYNFLLAFVAVVIWNLFSPWPIKWWGWYFFIVTLIVPGIMALISTFWFGIGGVIDLFQLFRDLKKRVNNPLDSGWVEGHVSLADKAAMEEAEKTAQESDENIKNI
ncbi:MAG: sodium:panthothenate symporter [Verrucomicrobia bacterium]|nr:sodium:panthothenate symporter [Verrucomicrobiota bacterium]MBU1734470.1 sodium:panthothenate symporter [Verrucomicrobiota bacterium]MBU1856066.1 sodium:panthothenate symporter [Verrucomicrobiota bacterium]